VTDFIKVAAKTMDEGDSSLSTKKSFNFCACKDITFSWIGCSYFMMIKGQWEKCLLR